MKSKYKVILVWALLCCVPAVTFFLFRDKNDSLGSYTKPTASAWPLEQRAGQYVVTLSPEKQPLQRGPQTLLLKIQQIGVEPGQASDGTPKVEIVMPMGSETMTAPVTTKKLPEPGQYQLQTEFSMAGDWQLLVTPKPAVTPLEIDFKVEL